KPLLEYVDDAGPVTFTDAERDILHHINQKIAAAPGIEETIDFLFVETHDICPCDRVALAFADETHLRVIAHYARADYEPLLLKKGYAEDLRDSSLERIPQQGHIRLIGDLEAYLREHPESRSSRLLVQEGVRSSMTCPLRVEGRNVGLFFRSSRRPHAYGAKQVRTHLAIAERLAQAVEKAYRIEQLEQANRAYSELLAFVTHELKSPVASMMMDATVLADGYLGEMSQQQVAKIHRMQTKGRYLLDLVDEYLSLARLEAGEVLLKPEAVDLVSEVILPAVEVVGAQVDQKNQKLVTDFRPDVAEVACDRGQLRIVMVNLLTNASKYGHEGGEIRIRARLEKDAFEIAVRNEGVGFTRQERTRLFRKFSRLDNPELRKQKGTGVGLYTVWRLVNLHGGRVNAASEPGQWAKFSLRIPQPLPAG
ncbi:MAG: ATP-binding protein, partial [Phycisphaerae bacterium]